MYSSWQTLFYAGAILLPRLVLASQQYLAPELLPPDFTAFQDDRPPNCPPCFNCNLENYKCLNTGNCTSSTGRCSCQNGFGDVDCAQPLCGSLAQGKDRPVRPDAEPGKRPECKCADGWEGINCNVCKSNKACEPLMPEGAEEGDAVCYTQGLVQTENYQMCDVTNEKVKDGLKNDGVPQVTFSCNAERKECNFQFWIGGLESFYCGLQHCKFSFDAQHDRNITSYTCENIQCSCIPGRTLCTEHGIDITPLLEDEITGPASFKTTSVEGGKSDSVFTEKHMDDLISGVFGDDSIFLRCKSGECLYKTSVPGFSKPIKQLNTPLIAGVIAGCSLFVVALIFLVWHLSRRNNSRRYGAIHVGDGDQDEMLMADHRPATLHFEHVSYAVNGKQILNGVQGAVRPGELLAIMGASGAGKTTFLDILARKNKKGTSQGDFYVNGERISDSDFRSAIGFVDQDDIMLPTLTVHETILDSAMLRLPADMSLGAKEQRVEDVEKQLGIYHIRDSIIGSEDLNGRGISGGEKRRVGIACELITSPSILFLDEPTSGLDAYNAYNVVECLVTLVKTYHRTVVFTIHQPRSNIVALFDQLILLAKGRTVYSGPFANCQDYFDNIGYSCPPGFNIADYLIDLTMHAGESRSPMDDIIEAEAGDQTRSSSIMAIKSIASKTNIRPSSEIHGSSKNSVRPSTDSRHSSVDLRRTSIKDQQDRQLFGRKQRTGVDTPGSQAEEEQMLLENAKEPAQSWLRLSKQTGNVPPQVLDDVHQLPPTAGADGTDLDNIIASYFDSEVAALVADDIKSTINSAKPPQNDDGMPPSVAGVRMKGYRKVGVIGQFVILSTRTWRNLYRNPMLMLTHYAIAILLAVFLGFLFYGVTDNIAGFQNRLGLFFFILALFGFGTLTSLTTFAQERLLFVRERAKGYYRPVSYFAAKVVFDIVPLRLIPPIILGAIVYPMTGLVPVWTEFLKFIAFLILFNFAASAICLFLGIIFRNGGVANLIGSLTMLFSLLFSGFLLNKDSIPKAVLWLQVLSIFHYGFEGLIVNEVRYLSLVDHKYGLDIEVPGAVILTTFGFNVTALSRDMVGLSIVAAAFLVLAYGAMHILLVERR